jgi:hypothetical protein
MKVTLYAVVALAVIVWGAVVRRRRSHAREVARIAGLIGKGHTYRFTGVDDEVRAKADARRARVEDDRRRASLSRMAPLAEAEPAAGKVTRISRRREA